MFLFGYAVLLYNMWTVANAIGADRDDDYDLGKHGRYWKAIAILSTMIDDSASLEIGGVPGGELSEFSETIRKECYLKFSV
jgi:hypothetical protein